MSFKKALILGGAILLAAGCSNSATAPSAARAGGAASNARTALPTLPKTLPRTQPAAAAASIDECFGAYPVSSGFVDSLCVIDPNP